MAQEICPRCKCCSIYSEPCDQCGGDGMYGHDCGEDTCCCLDPDEPTEECDSCGGRGFFVGCIGRCDENGKHEPCNFPDELQEGSPR